MKKIKLTAAQIETLGDLLRYGPDREFLPHEQFTARDNRDNGARRIMNELIRRGLIVPVNAANRHGNRYHKISPELFQAYRKATGY